jgi:hypothetical protein
MMHGQKNIKLCTEIGGPSPSELVTRFIQMDYIGGHIVLVVSV